MPHQQHSELQPTSSQVLSILQTLHCQTAKICGHCSCCCNCSGGGARVAIEHRCRGQGHGCSKSGVYLDLIYLTLCELCLQLLQLLDNNRDQSIQESIHGAPHVADCARIFVLRAVEGDRQAVKLGVKCSLLNLQLLHSPILLGCICLSHQHTYINKTE